MYRTTITLLRTMMYIAVGTALREVWWRRLEIALIALGIGIFYLGTTNDGAAFVCVVVASYAIPAAIYSFWPRN